MSTQGSKSMLAVRVSENRGAKGMIEVESGFSIPIFSEQAKTNPGFFGGARAAWGEEGAHRVLGDGA
jgi:hypothetical protein